MQNILLIRKSYAIFLFRAILIIFLCFEIIFGTMNIENISYKLTTKSNYYIIEDVALNYRIRPNCVDERSTLVFGGDTIYDVYYSSDEFGRRIPEKVVSSSVSTDNSFNKKHAVFLGCSYTFGYGLADSSSFPLIFELNHPDFKSYNYGVAGYGPNQISLLFNEGINTINNKSVPEDSGFSIYTFIDDHLNRVYGGSFYLYNGGKTPDVNVINNKLECDKRPKYLKNIAWFLNNSETMKYFNITNSYPKTESFYKRFASLINYMADKYWAVKPHDKFYVGLYPHCATDTTWLKFLDEKIKVLKIPSPIDYDTNPTYMNNKFWHPKKGLNSYYEKEISKLILKK